MKVRLSPAAIVALFVMFGVLCASVLGEALLVESGQPLAEIVVAERPARMARLAASELQAYIEKISGAKLPIVAEPTGQYPVAVYVGKSAHTERLGIDTTGLAHGAYRVASGEDWLALVGPDEDFAPVEPWIRQRSRGEIQRVERELDNILDGKFSANHFSLYAYYHEFIDVWEYDNAGTLNAVYDFLREQGVRWYFPGELGEIVPRKEDIPLPDANRAVRPDFDRRELEYWSLSLSQDHVLWNFRMGLNRGREIRGMTQPGHGMKFVHGREEYQAAHPEHFALWDGERATGHKRYGAPCLSSHELLLNHLNYVRGMFDHFGERMMSLDMVDGYGRGICECEKCAGLATPERGWQGSMSDYVWGYINRVAQEIHKSHPDRMVSGGVYSAYRLPPENIQQMSPNLAMIGCRWRSSFHDRETRDQWRQLRQAWLEKLPSKEWSIRDYYIHARFGGPWQGIPVYFPRLVAEDLRDAKGVARGERIGVYHHQGDREFAYNEFAVQHLNLYVTTRLWWDVDQDVDAMLEEFYAHFYGPVREEMKAFIEYCEANWMHMRQDGDKIERAFELLGEAQAGVDSDSPYGRRIRLVADYIRPLRSLKEQLARKRENVPDYRALRTGLSGRGRMAGTTLDGRLDEAWETVTLNASLLDVESGNPPEHATSFRILREGEFLYFGIRCAEPDTASLNIPTTDDDDEHLFDGDFVTLLIETPNRSYYEIAVNPAGALLDIDRGDGEANIHWGSGAEAAAQVGEDYWSVEIRLPIAGEGARDLDPLSGLDGNRPSDLYPWYFNVCRHRPRNGEAERTAYSPTGESNFHVLERFARMWGK